MKTIVLKKFGMFVLLLAVAMLLCTCGAAQSEVGPYATSGTSVQIDTATLPRYPLPDDSYAVAMNDMRDYRIIVNEQHPYEFGGVYDQLLQDDLVYVADCYGEPTPVEKAAYLAFSQLQADLHERGIEIALYSAYRTEADQQWVVDYYGNRKDWSETNKVMQPGYSEHHTGLVIEYVVWYNGGDEKADWEWTTVTADRAKDPYYAPIAAALADHGFIMRYPDGKESVTGVPYEPYELRFVGSSNIARYIAETGVCLEEITQEEIDAWAQRP